MQFEKSKKSNDLLFLIILLISFTPVTLSSICIADSSVNIPVGSSIYRDLEMLEVKGLIKSGVLATKPFARLEAVRLIKEAEENWNRLSFSQKTKLYSAEQIVRRLRREFDNELIQNAPRSYIRFNYPYIKTLYSDRDAPHFSNENNNGDLFEKGANLRAGFALSAGLFNIFSFYLNPEYRLVSDGSKERVLYCYFNLDIKGVEIVIGRDSMWWGSGYHGDLLLTNNTKPFDMIRISSTHPFSLPYFLGYLGLLKPTIFLTKLEKSRDFFDVNLLGIRLDMKPSERFQIGISRVVMYGGKGRPSLNFNDWVNYFFEKDGAEPGYSPKNVNQIASIDASYLYINELDSIPFSSIKVYTEWGAEDSDGIKNPLKGWANIYGVFFDEPLWLRLTDLRIEWANTARTSKYGPLWYKHYVFKSGYTYHGNVIGHHIGSDAQDIFLRLQHYMDSEIMIGIETDMERTGIHGNLRKKKWIEVDLAYNIAGEFKLSGGIGRELSKNPPAIDKNANVIWGKAEWTF